MLLGILHYLIERATQATVRLVAQTVEAGVVLSITVEPPEIIQTVKQAEVGDRLLGLEEMAALTGAHISPMHAGQSIVGFDVHLPTAERTLLVVDDNEDVLRLFQSFLSPHGYRVVTAQTAPDALEKASQFRPYAITLDLMMPGQDGWELLQILLNQPDTCHIPIIVCTVLKQKDLALSLGATGFLEKPVTEQALLSAIEALEKT
jgi:CheY-like chemotaxis protein